MSRRPSHPRSFQDRLTEELEITTREARRRAPGPEQDALLKKMRLLDVACHFDRWLTSPESQSSK
jgi:hypothetical protein